MWETRDTNTKVQKTDLSMKYKFVEHKYLLYKLKLKCNVYLNSVGFFIVLYFKRVKKYYLKLFMTIK